MTRVFFILFLYVIVCSCKDDRPIEIYRMNKLKCHRNHQYFVIYNHRGKTENDLVNSVIDFNRATICLDTILKFPFFRRTFYLNDKILTRDFEDRGEDSINDFADKKFVDIAWDNKGESKYKCRVYYSICNKQTTPDVEYWWEAPQQLEPLLNPIPRR